MDEEFKNAMSLIESQVILLFRKWETYNRLFRESETTVKILNQVDGYFFYLIQKVLLESIVIGLGKLLDPAETKNDKNLSLETLIEFIEDKELKQEISYFFNTGSNNFTPIFTEIREKIKPLRHKVYAHNDYNVLLKMVSFDNKIEFKNIEFALTSIEQFLNQINMKTRGGVNNYRDDLNATGKGIIRGCKKSLLLIEIFQGLNKNELSLENINEQIRKL